MDLSDPLADIKPDQHIEFIVEDPTRSLISFKVAQYTCILYIVVRLQRLKRLPRLSGTTFTYFDSRTINYSS